MYIFMSHYQNAGLKHNTASENAAILKCLGMTIINSNYVHRSIKNGLNSGNAG
jgi:hypothetical protein